MIGIGNYIDWCCGGSIVPPGADFLLAIRNTLNSPPPAGCESFEMTVTRTRAGVDTVVCQVTKISAAAANITNPNVQVRSTDTITVSVTANNPTTVNCQLAYNSTEAIMQTGTMSGTLTTRLQFTGGAVTQTYSFSPVQNSEDFINIYGIPSV